MTAHYAHAMPFGAALQPDRSVRFGLWAPSAAAVSVALDDGALLPMEPSADGWFELTTDAATAGSRYRFRLPDGREVPDPASRFQPDDVTGPSLVVDPAAYAWRNAAWRGRPWREAVVYELHVGTFTPEGTYRAAMDRLDHLADLGVTAVELMPLSDFPGARNWGYDGVLPFAPDGVYGAPEDLKALIDACHDLGMMAFLDVVYNHFGPEGNHLGAYAGAFFTDRHHTPWGAAINVDGAESRPVREFFIHNALYWLNEYRFDGLRLDAVHAIIDDSDPDLLTELAERVNAAIGRDRLVHLILENDANEARRLERDGAGRPRLYTAQWNDDFHHAAHVLATGEGGGYYADFMADAPARMARALAEGFVYQGEPSSFRGGERRGEPSAHLPPVAFVNFLQNHDQIGNRAFGERLTELAPSRRVEALLAATLLAPGIPMLFQGEEWGERRPFYFFCHFHGDLAQAVRDGRRREFAGFPQFADESARERIPDPVDEATFLACKLDWDEPKRPAHAARLAYVKTLLAVRAAEIAPRLDGAASGGRATMRGGGAFDVVWMLGDGAALTLVANLGDDPAQGVPNPSGRVLAESDAGLAGELALGRLPGWSVVWTLDDGKGGR